MKNFIANLPIKFKLLASMLTIVIAAEVITVISFQSTSDKYVNEYVKTTCSQIAAMIADRNTSIVDFVNESEIKKSLDNVKSFDELENVHIYDAKGKILAEYNRSSSIAPQSMPSESSVAFSDDGKFIMAFEPIVFKNETYGIVFAKFNTKTIQIMRHEFFISNITKLLLIIIFVIVIVLVLNKILVKPINELSDTMEKIIKNGDYSTPPAQNTSNDEVGVL